MVLIGSLVNGVTIVIGSLIGLMWRNIPSNIKSTVLHAISLAVVIIGTGMALKSNQILIVIFSLAFGAVLGEYWDIEGKLNRLGTWIETKMGAASQGTITKGFVTATLVYCIGAMSIVGAIDSGLRQDHQILYTKSMLDGFTAIIFSSTLGIGVLLSFIPVVIYQGTITLFAIMITKYISTLLLNSIIAELTATGGILIMAIGLNLLEVTKIKIGNLLPSIILVCIFTSMDHYFF